MQQPRRQSAYCPYSSKACFLGLWPGHSAMDRCATPWQCCLVALLILLHASLGTDRLQPNFVCRQPLLFFANWAILFLTSQPVNKKIESGCHHCTDAISCSDKLITPRTVETCSLLFNFTRGHLLGSVSQLGTVPLYPYWENGKYKSGYSR